MTRPTTAPSSAGSPTDDAISQTGALLAELRGGSGIDSAAGSRARRRLSSQTVLTGMILVVGAGMLYGMRQYGMKSGMTFQTVSIDWDQTRATAKPSAEEQRILSALGFRGETPQVPSEKIDKNPFLLSIEPPTELPSAVPGTGGPTLAERLAELARQRAEQRAAELRAALARIELNSIVTGSRPVAKINGRVHVVGDVVAEHFRLAAIDGRSVTLEADGVGHVVEIGQQPPR